MRIALAQFDPVADTTANADKVVAMAREAADAGARLLLGPEGALVRYLDADVQFPGYKRWRFPVFDSGAWSQNRSSGGFFLATVRRRRALFEKAVRDTCERVAQRITQ